MNPDPVAPPTARDYLRILLRRWLVIVAAIVLFTLAGFVYSNRGPTIYKSTSEVRFATGGTNSVDINSSNKANSGTADRDVLTEVEVIKARTFKDNIIERMGLGDKAIKQAKVSNILNTNVIKITIGMPNKDMAAKVANEYATVYLDQVAAQQADQTKKQTASILTQLNAVKKQVSDLQAQIAAEAKRVDGLAPAAIAAGQVPPRGSATLDSLTAKLNQIEPIYTSRQQQYDGILVANAISQPTVRQIATAIPATKKSQPQPIKDGLVGLGLGIVLGIIAAFVFELLSDRVRSRQDVERFSRLAVMQCAGCFSKRWAIISIPGRHSRVIGRLGNGCLNLSDAS